MISALAQKPATLVGMCLGGLFLGLPWVLSDASLTTLISILFLAPVALILSRRSRPGPVDDPALQEAFDELDLSIESAAKARREMRIKAETAGRFREEFVAAVRHELKTPLNAILGFTEVLISEIDGPLTEDQKEDVDAIADAGRHLQQLVETVLDAWVPDDRDSMPIERVDVGALLQEVARLLGGQVGRRPIELSVEVEEGLPRPFGDSRRIRQILINIGTNALTATAQGSICFSACLEPDGVRLSVRDTGSGIEPSLMPHLFGEFIQGRDAEDGVGLGLAITRSLVEWHGGRIEVETTPGVGSCFHVILPVVAAP